MMNHRIVPEVQLPESSQSVPSYASYVPGVPSDHVPGEEAELVASHQYKWPQHLLITPTS